MEEWQMRELPSRRSGSFWFWLLAALLAAAVLAASVLKPAGPGGDFSVAGKSLSALSLTPLTGADSTVGAGDLKGRVSVVNFWGTWCPPCLAEFPHMLQLRERFRRHRQFQLLAVSCGTGLDNELTELHEETTRFLADQGTEMPIYADPGAKTRMAVAELLNAEQFSYPTTLLIDADAKLRGVWVGYRPGDELEVDAMVAKLLKESGGTRSE